MDSLYRVERHGDGAYEQVADGQRGNEVVCRLPDVSLDDKRQNHDQISSHCHHDGRPSQ